MKMSWSAFKVSCVGVGALTLILVGHETASAQGGRITLRPIQQGYKTPSYQLSNAYQYSVANQNNPNNPNGQYGQGQYGQGQYGQGQYGQGQYGQGQYGQGQYGNQYGGGQYGQGQYGQG